jgi:membrane protease YdiL (CAAX protease family)
LAAIFSDCASLCYCWAGVYQRGGNLEALSGGRWNSGKALAQDVAIAVPFWVVGDRLLPRSLIEILIWIAVSITAGFCEELIFRGYLQRQLHALNGSLVVAVVGQGVVFGLGHSYPCWKQVIVISVLGVLDGVPAVWRKNLRANVISHAATDIWEGWLKMVVWRSRRLRSLYARAASTGRATCHSGS